MRSARRDDFLQTIHVSAKHLLNLINDILDLSKIEADRLEVEKLRCSPHEVISEIVSVMRVKASEKDLTWTTTGAAKCRRRSAPTRPGCGNCS